MPAHETIEELRQLLDKAGDDVGALVDEIKPLLYGHNPALQGAVLSDLVALWLSGHHPAMRQIMFDMHVEAVPRLVEVNDQILFGDKGFPGEAP